MDRETYITLPIPKQWADVIQSTPILLVLGIVFAITTYLAISTHREKLKPLFTALRNPGKYALPLLFIILFPLSLIAVYDIYGLITDTTAWQSDKRGLAVLLAAITGAPFVIWRTWIAQKQSATAEQSHMTDRITKAVEQLGAEKTIVKDGKQETVPNLEVRLGAIYALERIAQDSLRDHIPVMEILCAYVRNNSPALDRRQSPHEVYDFLASGQEDEPPLDAEEIYADRRYIAANPFGWVPVELDDEKMRLWVESLPEIRSDTQAVLTVIGRRRGKQRAIEQHDSFVLDLKKSNLQKALLTKSFDGTDFDGSHLDDAELVGSFNRIKASVTTWQGARARAASLSKSVFLGSNLNYAYFGGADLKSSDMRCTKVKKLGCGLNCTIA